MGRGEILLDYIKSEGNVTSEYRILKYLRNGYPNFFAIHQKPLSFYQTHFYLFHRLYKLRNRVSKLGQKLIITALEIRLVDLQYNFNEMTTPDALVSFYLNESNIHIPELEVENMLKNFWLKYSAVDQKALALDILELSGCVNLDLKKLKNQFNKLALEKHPDRGGTTSEFREIKQAYLELKQLLS